MSGPPVHIVDDDLAIRRLLELMLADEGFDVSASATGDEALDHLSATPQAQVVLLDVLLPGIDGWEVLRRLRDGAPRHRVVVMTAGAVASERSDEFPGIAVVAKPFDPDRLVAAIRDAAADL